MDGKNVKCEKTLLIRFEKNSDPPVAGYLFGKAKNQFRGPFEKIGKDKKGVIWNVIGLSTTLMAVYGEEAKEEKKYYNRLSNLKYILFKNDNRDLTIKTKDQNKSLIFKKVKDLLN